MNSGTLSDLIKMTGGSLDEEVTTSIMKDVLAGLCVIHEKNYIHRDLKPENILLNIEEIGSPDKKSCVTRKLYTAKIADFGLSAEIRYGLCSGTN